MTIMMNRAQHLLEKFAFSLRTRRDYIEVFLNPDTPEWKEIGPDIRFLANLHTKQVWCWNASFGIHIDIAEHLGIPNLYTDARFILGQGTYDPRERLVTITRLNPASTSYQRNPEKYYQRHDMGWLKFYSIDIDSYMHQNNYPYGYVEIEPAPKAFRVGGSEQ